MNAILELEIGPGAAAGTYSVRVIRSVGGSQPTAEFALDVDALLARRALFETTVLSSAVSARRVVSDLEATVQQVGRQLFDAVFEDAVGEAYRTSLAVAQERGTSLQLKLRLTAPKLAALPWESLYDAETGSYLCRKEPLVRNMSAPYTAEPLAIEAPLRILGIIASPRGLPYLDAEAERSRLEQALQSHVDAGLVDLVWLDDVSWNGIHAKLLEQPWHVLHFIGHGGFDAATDEGQLALVGEDGRAEFVTASSLADLLHEAEPTPRLVVLNSCMSGAASEDDLFSGTASALVRSGIHAVAAMQFAIATVISAQTVSVSVPGPADASWTPTEIACTPGEVLLFVASGTVQHGPTPDRRSGPAGTSDFDPAWNVAGLENENHAALIGRLDGQTPFVIGTASEVECPADGHLELGINDNGSGNLENVGSLDVAVIRETQG